jgi:hypothetical protein
MTCAWEASGTVETASENKSQVAERESPMFIPLFVRRDVNAVGGT